MSTDMRSRYAETLGLCLNGPASDGRGWFRSEAERIDCYRHADQLLAVHDEEMEHLQAERDALKEANADLDNLIRTERQQHEATLAERDALKAAIEIGQVARFAADVARLVADYSSEERGIIALTPFTATLDQLCLEKYGFDLDKVAALDAPSIPESPGVEQIADERPVGVHAFEQNPAATQVSVCICGKWRDHHVHGADPCGCDECRAAPESPESEETP